VGEAEIPLVQLTGGEVSLLTNLNDYADHLSLTSKVSIVTNGIRRCDLTKGIRKIFLSLHGDKKTHERITKNPDTYDTIVENIQHYVGRGFIVAADVILCTANYKQMYDLIRTAKELGMTEVYINRFQGGGFGVEVLTQLMPPITMFRDALGQLIAGRNDFGLAVGFGTSIPLCIDKRLITEGFEFNCQMGVKFAAIAPDGEMRACNQALKGYGNVTQTPIEEIWKSDSLDDYRDLSWVTGVCADCELLDRCGTGCRVDNSQNADYCPDAFVRDMDKRPDLVSEILAQPPEERAPVPESPLTGQRRLKGEPNLLIIRKHPEKYLVRDNYSSLTVDDVAAELCGAAQSGITSEQDLWTSALRQLPHRQLSPALLGRYVDHLVHEGVLIEA